MCRGSEAVLSVPRDVLWSRAVLVQSFSEEPGDGFGQGAVDRVARTLCRGRLGVNCWPGTRVCRSLRVQRSQARAIILQHKTQRPVQIEITAATRDAVQAWIKHAGPKPEDFLFPSPVHNSPHLKTRQYARILGGAGRRPRTGPGALRHALDATNEGNADLPTY